MSQSENTETFKEEEMKQTSSSLSPEEQNVYKQVLEKLAVQNNTQDIQEIPVQAEQGIAGLTQNPAQAQTKALIENAIKQDFLKIETFVKSGLIDSLQEKNLKTMVLKKAFDSIVQNEKNNRNLSPAPTAEPQNKDEVFREFEQEKPDFFNTDSRKEVLDYLKSENVSIGKDDINKISQMVENIEQNAIDRYLKQTTYEKNLQDSNELAKQRLTANAQKSGFQDTNLSRIFTREQIGKMNSTEFAKYEPIIMDQLKKGLIR